MKQKFKVWDFEYTFVVDSFHRYYTSCGIKHWVFRNKYSILSTSKILKWVSNKDK